tara:strand:+ start:563 stop:1240 length:678 start_codon:yes stop_codon:yes gene_type:complete
MKKSKVWNDKHYKRMQTIFESQGIKVNFDSLNEGGLRGYQYWTDKPDSWPMGMDPKSMPGFGSGMYNVFKAVDADIWAQEISQGENQGQVEYYNADDFQISPDEVPAEWRREIESRDLVGKDHAAVSDDDDIDYDVQEVPHLGEGLGDINNTSKPDAELIRLLSQISAKLDGLKDIDTSIDYLVSALSGEHALAIKAKQGMFGRGAPIKPVELKEYIKTHLQKSK